MYLSLHLELPWDSYALFFWFIFFGENLLEPCVLREWALVFSRDLLIKGKVRVSSIAKSGSKNENNKIFTNLTRFAYDFYSSPWPMLIGNRQGRTKKAS